MILSLKCAQYGHSIGVVIPPYALKHFKIEKGDLIELDIRKVYYKEEKTEEKKE